MISTQYSEIVNIYKVDGDANAYLRLRDYIARRTGIIAGRKARQSKGDARAYGLIFDSKRETWEEEEDREVEGDDDVVHSIESTAWSRDPVSLLPSTLEETVVEFLDSGFQPAQNGVLRSKLIEVAKNDINSHYKPPKFYFTVPNSCYAMIIPGEFHYTRKSCCPELFRGSTDPIGILRSGQCYVHSSKGFQKVLPNGLVQQFNVVVGDVLVCERRCMNLPIN
jgi:RNA-dependent RNA polymerase